MSSLDQGGFGDKPASLLGENWGMGLAERMTDPLLDML